MKDLIRLFSEIALLRRGPQDVPASALLLTLTVAGYLLVTLAAGSVFPPFNGPWVGHVCVHVVFMFVWYALLLKLVGRPERLLQTATAMYGFQAILSPWWVAATWLTRRFDQESIWNLPTTLLSVALLIWIIAANSHIVRAALEWPVPLSVALVILQTLTGDLVALSLYPLSST
jgi:hypothetical protein